MVTFFKQQKIHNKAGKIQICQSESSGLLPKDDNEGDADNKDDNDDNDIDVDDEVAVDPVQGEDEHVVADLETVISPIKVRTGCSTIVRQWRWSFPVFNKKDLKTIETARFICRPFWEQSSSMNVLLHQSFSCSVIDSLTSVFCLP